MHYSAFQAAVLTGGRVPSKGNEESLSVVGRAGRCNTALSTCFALDSQSFLGARSKFAQSDYTLQPTWLTARASSIHVAKVIVLVGAASQRPWLFANH